MINSSKMADMESQNNNDKEFKNTDSMTLEAVVDQCRQYVTKNSSLFSASAYDSSKIREETRRKIDMFIDEKLPKVEGYENNLADLRKVIKDILTDYDILTPLMEDREVGEIQMNSKDAIFYEKGGEQHLFPAVFIDAETYQKVVAKLNGDSVRLTHKTPFVNTRTIEGYRANITHPSISAYDDYTVTIRKISERKFVSTDVLRSESIPIDALKFIMYLPKMHASWLTVGATGSGKTVLNGLILGKIPKNERVITIENPTELRLLQFDEKGRIANNVLQFQSLPPSEEDVANPNFPSPYNLLSNSLRQTPVWIIPGEIRAGDEFRTVLRAALTGHHVTTTFHAKSVFHAMNRYLTAYLEDSNEPPELVMRNICSQFNFVILQERLSDGTRKVMSIAEIVGSNGTEPIINMLWEFVVTGNTPEGKILGIHRRVNAISSETRAKMLKSGIPLEEVDKFSRIPVEGNYGYYMED